MADADHALDFWRSVATAFRDDRAVLFDLYNEPHAVRSTGARQPLLLGGLGWSRNLDGYMPWADRHGISYLGWTWDAHGGWTCRGGPTLIRNYAGADRLRDRLPRTPARARALTLPWLGTLAPWTTSKYSTASTS